MTYRQLKERINKLSENQLDCDITVYKPDEDEYYPTHISVGITEENDVLDEGHPYFLIF